MKRKLKLIPKIVEKNGLKKIQLDLIEKEVTDKEFLKQIPWFLNMTGELDLIKNNLFPVLRQNYYVIPKCSYVKDVNELMLGCLNYPNEIDRLFQNFYEKVYKLNNFLNLEKLFENLEKHQIIHNDSIKPFKTCIKAIKLLEDDAPNVVIPTLFVILENIWDDLFPTQDRRIKKNEIVNHCKSDMDKINATILNDIIFEYTKQGIATNPYLNRNKILHGECKNYANTITMYVLITQIEFLSGLSI